MGTRGSTRTAHTAVTSTTRIPEAISRATQATTAANQAKRTRERGATCASFSRPHPSLKGDPYGADTNGFGSQGGPRGAEVANPVTYPFTGFGGVTVGQQHSGSRVYDINTDGVAHYGLYPDWIEDLRRIAGDEIVEDMARGPEAYLQMWERAVGVPPNACRSDMHPLLDEDLDQLEEGMSPEDVLWTLGQPASRAGSEYTFCVSEDRTATLTFDEDGTLAKWKVKKN
jgi:hypothetical protein